MLNSEIIRRTSYSAEVDGYEVLLRVGPHCFRVVADLPYKAVIKSYKEVISSNIYNWAVRWSARLQIFKQIGTELRNSF